MKVSTSYAGGMRFASGEGAGRVVMDALPEAGGKGEALTPKQMVLVGLAGCTGMDVASMLERQKIPFGELHVDVEADQTGTHPKVFKSIRIVYRIEASAAHRAKVERAIELSRMRYCGVSAMLARTAEIEDALELIPPR